MIRTHYDSLQVSRHATDLVIRAAYKGLAQKYHPDKYDGAQGDAQRIMKILNEAYAILSDPILRKQHDEWIDRELAATKASNHTETLNKDEELGRKSSEKERMHAANFGDAAPAGGGRAHAAEPPPQRNKAQDHARRQAIEQHQFNVFWKNLSLKAKGHWCLFGTLLSLVLVFIGMDSHDPNVRLLLGIFLMVFPFPLVAAIMYYLEFLFLKK